MSRSTRGSATSRYSVTDAGWSGDRERRGQAARGWDLGDTRRAVLQQGSDGTLGPGFRPASRRCCPREPADSEPVRPSRGS
jgi:hypothetical protein